MTTNTNGVLSQAIANMKNAGSNIANTTGLPQEAISIQKNVGSIISNLVPKLENMQSTTLNLAIKFEDQINTEISQLLDINGGLLKRFLTQINAEVQPVDTLIKSTFADAISANDQISKDEQQLQQIGVDLKGNIAGLNSQLSGEKQKLDALNKNKLYLLGLGFLGLPGLIALAVLLSQAQDDVSNTENKINNINNQINTQAAFLNHVTTFAQSFSTLISKISGISNSLNFLTGDLGNIAKDIDHGEITSKAEVHLYLNVALQEVKTLQKDVS
jgi:hypothetical protein